MTSLCPICLKPAPPGPLKAHEVCLDAWAKGKRSPKVLRGQLAFAVIAQALRGRVRVGEQHPLFE